MPLRLGISVLAILSCCLVITNNCSKQSVALPPQMSQTKRVGMVIGIKPEFIEEYKRLHSDHNPGIRDLLQKYHIHNFNIFLQQMPDGNWYEFAYYEYTGDDFDGDMAKLSKEPRNIEWLKKCNPMQTPLPNAVSWTQMEQVFFSR